MRDFHFVNHPSEAASCGEPQLGLSTALWHSMYHQVMASQHPKLRRLWRYQHGAEAEVKWQTNDLTSLVSELEEVLSVVCDLQAREFLNRLSTACKRAVTADNWMIVIAD